MPLEPLQTDEKLESPVKKAPDMDTVMLFGCSGFVATALITYMLSIWPFLVLKEIERLPMLIQATLFAAIPTMVAGIFSTRRFGLAGACGFIGGAVSTTIFLFLRLQQVFLAAQADQAPTPDYPTELNYVLPFGWLVVTLILALGLLPKREMLDSEPDSQ